MRNVVKPPFFEVMVIGGYGADAGQSTEVLSVQERARIRLLSCPAFSSERGAQRALGHHSARDVPAALPPCPLRIFFCESFLGRTSLQWHHNFSKLSSRPLRGTVTGTCWSLAGMALTLTAASMWCCTCRRVIEFVSYIGASSAWRQLAC